MSAGWCEQPSAKTAASGEDANDVLEPDTSGVTTNRPGSATPVRQQQQRMTKTGTMKADDYNTTGGLRNSRTSLKSTEQGVSSSNGAAAFVATKTTYVIERCENEFDNIFREVYRTTAGEGTINHLSPGQSYRFRVYGRNIDGGVGAPSETVIVHALLETPPAPMVISRWPSNPVGAHAIVLQWRARRHGVTSRDSGVVKRMIGDWTGVGEEEGGVSVETAFMKYDR